MSRLLLTGGVCALPGEAGSDGLPVDGPRIAPATLAIEGDRIAAVLERSPEGTEFADFEPFDCAGKLVIPGLINAHTHAVLLALRGTIEDIEGNLVYQYMVPVSYLLAPEERAAIARLACAEAIRSGTTTLVDPLRHVADYAPAMAATGLRLWLAESCADAVTTEVGRGTYRFDRDFGQTFVNRTEALIERFHGSENDRVRVMMAAHGPDNCSPWMLGEVSRLAARHGLRRTIHLSQIISEKEQVETLHGCTSTEYLDRNGFLGDDLLAVHWTFCTDSDVEILARRGVHFIHSPASMSAKGPHPAPVRAIQEAGINIALGSDNMTEDMFQSMKSAMTLHRGAWGRSVRPSPGRVFDYATVNAARALDRPDLGRIAVGAKADLATIDLKNATMAPAVSLISNLTHYGHPGLVVDTMTDGRFLMRDRKLTTIDETAAVDEAQAATRSMWRKFEAEGHDAPLPRFDDLGG